MDSSDAIAKLSALSQETRLDAFRLLVKAGHDGLAAGALAEALGVRQNTMSANLAVLLNAGLVRNEREGRSIRYFAEISAMAELLSFLMQDCCGGRPEMCRPVVEAISSGCGPASVASSCQGTSRARKTAKMSSKATQ